MIEELDVVALTVSHIATDDDGNPVVLPAGTEGTVVITSRDHQWFTVEFQNPDWQWEDDGTDNGKHNDVTWISILADSPAAQVRLVWKNPANASAPEPAQRTAD